MMPKEINSIEKLYKLEADCTPEAKVAIGLLRQLINEEFVPKNRLVPSQMIYDMLKDVIR